MTAFLAVVALGALIAYSVMAWGDPDRRIRYTAFAGVGLTVLAVVLEIVVSVGDIPLLTPGHSFALGVGLGFGISVPGMILLALRR